MRITRKGQVTIPQAIREKAGLHPYTEVEFEMVDGKVLLKPGGKASARGERAVECLRGTLKRAGMTADQIMALMRNTD